MKKRDQSLHTVISNHHEYRSLKKLHADGTGKPKGKKNKYGRKAYVHLAKAIGYLKRLEEAKDEFLANQDKR